MRAPARRRGAQHTRFLALIVALCVLAGVVYLRAPIVDNLTDRVAGEARGAASQNGELSGYLRPDGWPPAPPDTSTTPLGVVPPAGPGGPHAFVTYQPDGVTPVSYDPCEPIRYVTGPGTPSYAAALWEEAVANLSAATGFTFINEGPTPEVWTEGRERYQPDVYGDRWAPVLVSWTDPQRTPELNEHGAGTHIAGFAGSASAGLGVPDGPEPELVYITGHVTLNAEHLTSIYETQGPDQVRAVMQHELAHLVGLDHVDDESQLMYRTTSGTVLGFADGDREGLATLGASRCFPDV